MVQVYLAQWLWDVSDPIRPHWSFPVVGALGCLDLRSLPQMSLAGGVPQGWGIFTYSTPVIIADALDLGDSLRGNLSGPVKNTLRIRLGLLSALTSNIMDDVLFEILTTKADPTGLLRCKPLMPTIEGNLDLHLGGFSPIKHQLFSFTDPEGSNVLAVFQDDYRRIRQERLNDSQFWDIHKRFLGVLVKRFGGDYRQLIPTDLPDEGMLEPHTVITDNFNRANADALGTSSEGWSWTEVVSDIDIFSNAAVGGSINQIDRYSRADSDLSTDAHYSQALCATGAGSSQVGVTTRFAAAAETFYLGLHTKFATNTYNIWKDVAGVFTLLANVNTTNPGEGPITDRMSSNGSTQQFVSGDVVRLTVTDTAITGNLRCGIFCQEDISTVDDFEAADLETGGRGFPTQMFNAHPRRRLGRVR